MTILCIGEMMVEVAARADGAARIGFGGDTFNTAVYLARCGHATSYLTVFGDDPWSATARAVLNSEGIGDADCPTARDETMGLYAIRTDASGERSFTYWRQNAPARGLFGRWYSDSVGARLQSARLIYLTGITLWLYDDQSLRNLFALIGTARAAGVCVAFDGNYRPRLWGRDRTAARAVYETMLRQTDICLATAEDEQALWDDACAEDSASRLLALGIGEVVVKAGEKGAFIGDGTWIGTVPDPNPVDTTAAGDSFNAAYLGARLSGLPARDAAVAGNDLAARVIRHPGALLPK
jgi:2-dehydro-3-deoxygluconokinase